MVKIFVGSGFVVEQGRAGQRAGADQLLVAASLRDEPISDHSPSLLSVLYQVTVTTTTLTKVFSSLGQLSDPQRK